LELAYDYGWKPAGTVPGEWIIPETGEVDKRLSPDPDEWDGNYVTNDFQWVTDKDAAHIADALEKALDDIPDFDTDEKWVEYGPTNVPTRLVERSLVEHGLSIYGPNGSFSPLEFFSGEAKQKIRDFIVYCRTGAFYIA
jgi:hypothetical protein